MIFHPPGIFSSRLVPATFVANDSDQPCTMTVETNPAGRVVQAFQLAYAVANDGGAANDGLPKNLLIRLRFVALTEGFLPGLPLKLQQFVLSVAALLAKLTGAERHVRRYIGVDKV
jgi:hypothetical protein